MSSASLIGMILLCLPSGALGPEAQQQSDPEVDVALSAPAELAADQLLALAASPARTRLERQEILLKAFHLAGSARYPLRRIGIVGPAYNTDSDAGVISSALSLGLDKLSLESRAIRQLLALDPAQAVEQFISILPVVIPPLTCEDALGFSLEDFNKTVVALLNDGFSRKAIAEGDRTRFAELLLQQLHSPFQLAGSIQILVWKDWPTEDLRRLVSTFNSSLARLSADDRAFTYATHSDYAQAYFGLLKHLDARQIDAEPTAQALHAWLLRQLAGPRCADTVNHAAHKVFLDLFSSTVLPIAPERLQPKRILPGVPRVNSFWETPESRPMLIELRTLRFGTAEQIEERRKRGITRSDRMAPFLSDEERSTISWQAELDRYLKRFHEWQGLTPPSAVTRFFETCSILRSLVILTTDSNRQRALYADLLQYLAAHEFRTSDPPLWLLQVDRALSLEELSAAQRQSLRQLAARSSVPYVAARLSRLTP